MEKESVTADGRRMVASGRILASGSGSEPRFVNVRFVLDREWVRRKERIERRAGRPVAYRELIAAGIEAMERQEWRLPK
jgi:hypothetical protein